MANTEIPEALKATALEWIAKGFSRRRAAMEVGFDQNNFKRWYDDDPDFKARFDRAYEAGNDVIRDEIRRRGVEGIEKPIYQGGQRVDAGEVREYSDVLLIFAAKSRMPEFRDHLRVDQQISGTVAVNHSAMVAASLNGGFSRTNRIAGLMAGDSQEAAN